MNKQTLRVADIDWSTFDLGHVNRTSLDFGNLVPIACIENLPNDQFEIQVSNFIRSVPTKVPLMENIDLKINHFYVPYRCLWDGFKDFISLADNQRISTGELPTVALENLYPGTKYKNGRLADYLGLGEVDLLNGAQSVSAMPFLAYQRIFLDHYAPKRWVNYKDADGNPHWLNQLRADLETIKFGDADQIAVLQPDQILNIGTLRRVNWNHDYFTNALPSPTLFEDQKLPLFTRTNIYNPVLKFQDGEFQTQGDTLPIYRDSAGAPGQNYEALATIRDLRTSIAMQHYLERLQQADGGYLETMKIHWNNDLPDDLLQRSEYLGGDVTTIFNNEVESNADTRINQQTGDPTGQKLGDVAGKPIGGGTHEKQYLNADEFGIYIAIAHIMPKRSYADVVNPMWGRTQPLDFPNPEFENIGDQAVYKYELTGNFAHQQIWGFVPRYSDWKTQLDRFSGEMRYTLKDWHLGTFKEELQDFPTISPEFMESDVREDIFQVPGEPDKFFGTFKLDIKAKRSLQNTAQPGISYI